MTSRQAKLQEDVYFRGMRLRQENPDLTRLEIIAVQSGSYLAGDDIVRLDDAYGRKSLWH